MRIPGIHNNSNNTEFSYSVIILCINEIGRHRVNIDHTHNGIIIVRGGGGRRKISLFGYTMTTTTAKHELICVCVCVCAYVMSIVYLYIIGIRFPIDFERLDHPNHSVHGNMYNVRLNLILTFSIIPYLYD